MIELISTNQNENGEILVSGRELHEFLEVKTAYKDWFPRMVEYGFIEGQDYIAISEKVGAQKRARTYEQVDHHLKLDMAKEVSMIQRNEKGKQARRYFIQIEKEYKNQSSKLPGTYKEALLALVAAEEEKEQLQLENSQSKQIISELQPKATYYDLVLQSKTLLSVSKIAKDYGMSAQTLNKHLHELGIQYKQGDCWLLYQKFAEQGYTQSKTHVIDNERSAFQTQWTQKGRLFIYDTLKTKLNILPLIERNV